MVGRTLIVVKWLKIMHYSRLSSFFWSFFWIKRQPSPSAWIVTDFCNYKQDPLHSGEAPLICWGITGSCELTSRCLLVPCAMYQEVSRCGFSASDTPIKGRRNSPSLLLTQPMMDSSDWSIQLNEVLSIISHVYPQNLYYFGCGLYKEHMPFYLY